MKLNCVLHYALAILQGALSGVLCWEAEKEQNKKRKVLLYITGAAWFVLSLTDSLQGGLALRELREAKAPEAEEISEGGNDDA